MLVMIYLAAAVGATSLTISRAKVFEGTREWIKQKNGFVGKLVSCPYCVSHWVAFALTFWYRRQLIVAWPVAAMALVAAAAPIARITYDAMAGIGRHSGKAEEEDGHTN